MATTQVDNTAQGRLDTLTKNGLWDSAAAKNLKTQLWATWGLTYVNNPDGTPVNANPPAWGSNVVNPTPTSIGQMPTAQVTPNTTAVENANTAEVNQSNQVIAEANTEKTNQQQLTTELGLVDQWQAQATIKNAQENQTQFEKIQNEQILQKTQNEMDYQAKLRQEQDAEVAALKLQQSSENVANQAAAAELKAKNDAAEYELQTQNEISRQQSNIAFAKLGLSFSWAAINTATQIYTQWVYNLAKLKTTDAKNYADLQVKINSVQFDHIQQINKLVQDTSEKEFNSKERLREFIGKAQNNILTNKEESQKNINDAIEKYKKEKQAREDKLYSDMNVANDRIRTATNDIQKTLIDTQDLNKKKIETMINLWQWSKLSPQQQADLESKAGVPAGSSTWTIVAKTTEMLTNEVKAITWKAVGIPNTILAKMHTEVQRALNMNIPLLTATKMAVQKYSAFIPEIAQTKEAAKAKAELDRQLTQSKIDLNKASETNKLQTAEAALLRAKKSWVSWASWLTTQNYQWVEVAPDWTQYDKFVTKSWQVIRIKIEWVGILSKQETYNSLNAVIAEYSGKFTNTKPTPTN